MDMKRIPDRVAVADGKMSPLLNLAVTYATERADNRQALRSTANADMAKRLQLLGFSSVFQITRLSRQRFVKRYDSSLNGQAGEIHDNARSFAAQIAQSWRHTEKSRSSRAAQPLLYADDSDNLPDYASLFPQDSDEFSRPGDIDAIDGRVNYLVELYKFTQDLELDASGRAVPLSERRPDLPDTPLEGQSLNAELPALTLINEVLTENARYYLDRSSQATTSVTQALNSTFFPFTLPWSLPDTQIHQGLAANQVQLGDIIRAIKTEYPFEYPASLASQTLLASTQLSSAQIEFLTAEDNFPDQILNRDTLTEGWLGDSVTSLLPDMELSRAGFIVADSSDVSGPLVLTQGSQEEYDPVTVTCRNSAGKAVTVTLRSQSVLSFQRVKARMVSFNDAPPYSRQLRLTLNEEDNASLGGALDDGPYYGELTVYGAVRNSQNNDELFATWTFRLALAAEGTDDAQLAPGAQDFLLTCYGLTDSDGSVLQNITIFGEQTHTSGSELEELLSTGEQSPLASSSVVFSNAMTADVAFPAAYHTGSVYINGGHGDALDVVKTSDGKKIAGLTLNRLERLNKFIRLSRWMNLPAYQLDMLIVAACKVEAGNTRYQITDFTLQVLGLWRYLNTKYNVTPETVAAWLYQVSPYATGERTPFFDKLFNSSGLFDEPLVLDGSVFSWDGSDEATVKTVRQLCAGLGISAAAFRVLAPEVQQALGLTSGTLARDAEVIAALYRQVSVMQLFGLNTEEGILLNKFFPERWVMMAKDPGSDTGVFLRTLLEIESTIGWLENNRLDVVGVYYLSMKKYPPAVSEQSIIDMYVRIEDTIVSSNMYLSKSDFLLTFSNIKNPEKWWDLLKDLSIVRDELSSGRLSLVFYENKIKNRDPEDVFRELISDFLTSESDIDPDDMNVIIPVLANYYRFQRKVFHDEIAAVYELTADLTPKVESLLDDNFLENKLYRLSYNQYEQVVNDSRGLHFSAYIIKKLMLEGGYLDLLLDGDIYAYADSDDNFYSNLYNVYNTSILANPLKAIHNSEQIVGDYFKYVLSDSVVEDTTRAMLAELLDWDTEKTTQVCSLLPDIHSTASTKYPRTLNEMAMVVRIKELCDTTGISPQEICSLAAITSSTDFSSKEKSGAAVVAALNAQGEENE